MVEAITADDDDNGDQNNGSLRTRFDHARKER